MKRILFTAIFFVLAGAWIYFTSMHYNGLNSLQNLANYNAGLLSKKPLQLQNPPTISTPFAGAEVNIDSLGIPHIFGKDMNAVAYAIGYMHARDRYFQMELMAYSMMGRQAEILGEAGIRSDRHWRPFEMEARAMALFDSLKLANTALYNYLNAYEKGINAYIAAEEATERDPLYTVWHYSPGTWKAWYVFLIQWYMSSDLTYYDDYVNRQEVLDKVPDTVRKALYPAQTVEYPYIVPTAIGAKRTPLPANGVVSLFQPSQRNNYQSAPVNRSLGSNNWVVGTSRTRSKEVLLSNDLHLMLVSPNIFYEMQLVCKEVNVYGYSIPGVPVIVTGHNGKIAWGITNGEWDVTEQYLLRIDSANKNNYWLDGKWQPMTTKDFVINVKDQAPVKTTARYTVFGQYKEKEGIGYGLKWHPLQSGGAVQAFWKLLNASGWNDFRDALRLYDYPAQNFVYGDLEGNIGVICAGKMPLKPAGYAGGLMDGKVSPAKEYIPFDSLPQAFNPAKDYLFSANQEPGPDQYYFSSRWFSDLYRPRRIDELLSTGSQLTWEDMRAMQLDVLDISVTDLKNLLTKYGKEKSYGANWDLLMKWDGKIVPGTKESTLFRSFRQATRAVAKEIAVQLGVKAQPSFDQTIHFLLHTDTLSYNGGRLEGRHYFERVIKAADSIYTGTRQYQQSPAQAYSFAIPQLTFLPGFEKTINGVGGNDNTINVNYGAHPVIRTVVELKAGAVRSWMVNATGQTGRINDKRYFQQLQAWKENRLHETQFVADPSKLSSIQQKISFSHE